MTENSQLTHPDPLSLRDPDVERGRVPAAASGARTGVAMPPDARRSPRVGSLWALLRRTWPLLAAITFTAGLFGAHIAVYNPLSPVDEIQHIDYTLHLMHGDLVVSGDTFTHETENILACRWIDTAGPLGMPCGGPYDLSRMPGGGFDTAYIHAPFYYLTPALTALAGKAVGVHGDLVDLMRLSSVFWWVLFALVAWRLFAELGVDRRVAAAGLVLIGAAPVVLQTYASVNNDVTALPAGAAVALAALLWDRNALRLRWLVVLAGVAVAVKSTNVVVVMAVALFLLIRHAQRHGARWRAAHPELGRTALAVAGLAAVSMVVALAWTVTEGHLQVMDATQLPQNLSFHVTAFRPVWLLTSVDAFLPPIAPEFVDSVLRSDWTTLVTVLTDYGLMILAIVGAARAKAGSRTRALGVATFVVALAAPSLFVFGQYVQSSIFVSVTSRYGLSLVPVMLGVGLTVLQSRTARIGAVVAAVVVAAIMAGQIVT